MKIPGTPLFRIIFLLFTFSAARAKGYYPNSDLAGGKPFSIELHTDPGGPNDSASATIPFTRAGNLIIVQAKAGELEGNFILDTGAPYLILNITYFRDTRLISAPEGEQGGITGSVARTERALVDSFRMNLLRYSGLEADLVDLGHLENNKGIRILGLLGMQLFLQCEMIIDYEKNLIYLHRIGRKEASGYKSYQLTDTSTYRTIPIMIKQDKILVYGQVADKKLLFLIDSGAESNVLDSRLPNRIFESVSITGRVVLNGAGRGRVEALQGDMKNLRIGNQSMASLPVLVTNLEKMCFAYDECLDGMLGFDFLSLRKIGFNFVKREMYIWK